MKLRKNRRGRPKGSCCPLIGNFNSNAEIKQIKESYREFAGKEPLGINLMEKWMEFVERTKDGETRR